jgi:hypothetical protein
MLFLLPQPFTHAFFEPSGRNFTLGCLPESQNHRAIQAIPRKPQVMPQRKPQAIPSPKTHTRLNFNPPPPLSLINGLKLRKGTSIRKGEKHAIMKGM